MPLQHLTSTVVISRSLFSAYVAAAYARARTLANGYMQQIQLGERLLVGQLLPSQVDLLLFERVGPLCQCVSSLGGSSNEIHTSFLFKKCVDDGLNARPLALTASPLAL
jgi:hypothetical protein